MLAPPRCGPALCRGFVALLLRAHSLTRPLTEWHAAYRGLYHLRRAQRVHTDRNVHGTAVTHGSDHEQQDDRLTPVHASNTTGFAPPVRGPARRTVSGSRPSQHVHSPLQTKVRLPVTLRCTTVTEALSPKLWTSGSSLSVSVVVLHAWALDAAAQGRPQVGCTQSLWSSAALIAGPLMQRGRLRCPAP